MSETLHYNILLVEDNAPNAVIAGTIIDLHGYSFLAAQNGMEGIEKFISGAFDLVLMDIQMPLLGGIETALKMREIEKNHGLSRTPIIAMTAYIASVDMEKCVEAGIDDIIPKPFHPDYFSKMLLKYCTKQKITVSS